MINEILYLFIYLLVYYNNELTTLQYSKSDGWITVRSFETLVGLISIYHINPINNAQKKHARVLVSRQVVTRTLSLRKFIELKFTTIFDDKSIRELFSVCESGITWTMGLNLTITFRNWQKTAHEFPTLSFYFDWCVLWFLVFHHWPRHF